MECKFEHSGIVKKRNDRRYLPSVVSCKEAFMGKGFTI